MFDFISPGWGCVHVRNESPQVQPGYRCVAPKFVSPIRFIIGRPRRDGQEVMHGCEKIRTGTGQQVTHKKSTATDAGSSVRRPHEVAGTPP